MRITPNNRVTIRLESAMEAAPVPPPQVLSFIYGLESLLWGLDQRLHGLSVGEVATLELKPYGERRDDLVTSIPATAVVDATDFIPGQLYECRTISGEAISFRLVERQGDQLVCDFNHPHAGRTMVVSAHVLDVRAATPEEILAVSQRCASG